MNNSFSLIAKTKGIALVFLVVICVAKVHAQTLQTVTDNGNVTGNSLYIRTNNKENSSYQSLVVGQRPLNDGVASIWLTGNNGNQNGQFAAISHHSPDNSLRLHNNGEDKLTINAAGNIGVGTNVPIARLHIVNSPQDSDGNTLILGVTGGSNLRLGYNTEYSWIQSHGSKPLFINEYGNNTVLNRLDGNVGIGILNPTDKLSVNGNIRAREIKVENTNWPDYVFTAGHKLRSLPEVERFISDNQHLPEVPSAEEVREKGINLGEINAVLLKKIEELTLYLIEKDKEDKALKERIERLETEKE